MTPVRLRSLQLRLAVQLAAVYVVATAIAAGILIYQAYDTAGTLNDRDLNLRAADLARYVSADSNKAIRLDLPSRLAAAYESGSSTDIFAVRAADGRVITASPPGFGEVVAKWPVAASGEDPSYFRLRDFGSASKDYYGLSIGLDSAAGPLSITVARATEADALASALLREFVVDVAWISPLLVLVTLAVGIFVIRRGLRPIRKVSEIAATIGPGTTSVRLSGAGLPAEVTPLVAAVNRALDRLEQGFSVQRKFTANAAHELRTPLAIITAALDAMEGNGELTQLRHDVARMNRLVEQLLRVARLDSVALEVSDAVDLKDVTTDVVATMAPWALAQHRMIAFGGPDQPVPVRGNKHAIGDAIRNLIENAIVHAPPRTEVRVSVQPGGSVSVLDDGPGVAPEDRDMIFERFWRGKGAPSDGAGLGLAIVREIMNAHRGSVTVDAGPNGGASFTLCFVAGDSATTECGPSFQTGVLT
jgi:signal transduction histidine kinase